jgi:hypothetical protein
MGNRIAAFSTTALLVFAACEGAPDALTAPDLSLQLDKNPVVEAVTGSGHYVMLNTQSWRTFSFNARRTAEGAVKGSLHIRHHRERGTGAKVSGTVTCFAIEGNQAWLAGYLTKARGEGNEDWIPIQAGNIQIHK